MPLSPNTLLFNKRYRTISLLGEGGYARVWLAQQVTDSRVQVVLKEPLPSLVEPSSDQKTLVLRRFDIEKTVSDKLIEFSVPHVVVVRDRTRLQDGAPVLLMDYMPHGSLLEEIKRHPTGMPWERVVEIAQVLCRALTSFHDLPMGPIHRDVKPSNILFDRQGQPCLADFGLTQLPGNSDRSILSGDYHPGTLAYMAPEQRESNVPLTPAADIFALGAVLFEALTGKRFADAPPGAGPRRINRDVPSWLDQAVLRALASHPWERWQGASDLADALQPRRRSPWPVSIAPRPPGPRPRQHVIAFKPPELCHVPAGGFWLGTHEEDPGAKDDERPMRYVVLSAYFISKYPVTVEEYQAFLEATGYSLQGRWKPVSKGRLRLPMTGVTWHDAITYCRWLQTRTGKYWHLPTEAQWEKAARGSNRLLYPWGQSPDVQKCNCAEVNKRGLVNVDTFARYAQSPLGVCDLLGNAFEWCADWYDSKAYWSLSELNPTGPINGVERVMRGGSYSLPHVQLRCVSRFHSSPGRRHREIGFRVACSEP